MRLVRFLVGVVAALAAVYAVTRARRPAPDRSITAVAESRTDSVPSCGGKVITSVGIGDLRIGENIDSVKLRCRVVRDTTQLGLEGMMERRAIVAFPPEMVEIEIVDDRVWRIDVTSPAFRTADSLGVGSTVTELLRHQDPKPMAGEGIVVVMVRDHCGVSFMISGAYTSGVFRNWTAEELSKLTGKSKVTKVLVFGCPRPRPSGATKSAP